MARLITRSVWILSLVSLFTDMASEMLYPVMPIYLKEVGFSIVLIGILEGVAEATAGLSKGYFGKLSDRSQKRLPYVQVGYTLSALSKPMMALFIQPAWIFLSRTMDRFGKGIRTGARDAMLAQEAEPATRARVFGFHRAMDTLGAVIGPLIALIYLHYHPHQYATLFLVAFLPGMMAIGATFLLREKQAAPQTAGPRPGFFSFLAYWTQGGTEYRKLVNGLLLFALVNSSDVFLLLKAKQAGLDDATVIGIYIFYNLVYAAFAFPMGALADRLGLRNIFLLGVTLFALVYLGMGAFDSKLAIVILFFVYGIYAASTEGISKAWISKVVAREQLATAIGTYTGLQSIAALIASALAGWIWAAYGASAAFYLSGMVSLGVVGYFLAYVKGRS